MKVAILVFPGVEELDFVGFLEALAVANRVKGRKYFETQLLGTRPGPVRCSGGMVVLPDKGLSALRGHELLLVPGGGARRQTGVGAAMRNESVLRAIRRTHVDGKMVWSVCTGALILSKAGLLKGRRAVTHHEFLKELGSEGARVVRRRTVTDGRVTTAGGISSSIDLGLLLVRKQLGGKVAREVGKRMEYPPPRGT